MLEEMLHLFTVDYDVSCGLVKYGLYYGEVWPLYVHFLEFLIINVCGFYWMPFFFCICWADHLIFFPFNLFIPCVTLICGTEPSFPLWSKSPFIMMCHPSYVLLEFSLPVLGWGFLHLYSSVMLAYNFFSVISFSSFGIRVLLVFTFGSFSSFATFLKYFEKYRY